MNHNEKNHARLYRALHRPPAEKWQPPPTRAFPPAFSIGCARMTNTLAACRCHKFRFKLTCKKSSDTLKPWQLWQPWQLKHL